MQRLSDIQQTWLGPVILRTCTDSQKWCLVSSQISTSQSLEKKSAALNHMRFTVSCSSPGSPLERKEWNISRVSEFQFHRSFSCFFHISLLLNHLSALKKPCNSMDAKAGPSAPKESNCLVQSRNSLREGRNWIHLTFCCLAGWVFWMQCGLGQMVMTVMSVFHQATHIRSTKAINPECAAQNCKSKKDLLKPQISCQETSKNTKQFKGKKNTTDVLFHLPTQEESLPAAFKGRVPPQGQGCLIRFICFKASKGSGGRFRGNIPSLLDPWFPNKRVSFCSLWKPTHLRFVGFHMDFSPKNKVSGVLL